MFNGCHDTKIDQFKTAPLNCRTLDECAEYAHESFTDLRHLFDALLEQQGGRTKVSSDTPSKMKHTFDAFMSATPMASVRCGQTAPPEPVIGLLLMFAFFFERAEMYGEMRNIQQLPSIPFPIRNMLEAIRLLRDIPNSTQQYEERFQKILIVLSADGVRQTAVCAILAEFYATATIEIIQAQNADSAVNFKAKFTDPKIQERFPVLRRPPLCRLYALTPDQLKAELQGLNWRVGEVIRDAGYGYMSPYTCCAHTGNFHDGHCPPGLHPARSEITKQYAREFAETRKFVRQRLSAQDYTSFDTPGECMRYFRQYMPLHMPQVEEAVLTTLKDPGFNQSRIHVLDIGGGPGTLYCILAGLLHRNVICVRNLQFDVSFVEPAKPFHDFLDVISRHVQHPRLNIQKHACRLDQLPERTQTQDVDWFFVANAITPLVKKAPNVQTAVDGLCQVMTAIRRRHSPATLTARRTLIPVSSSRNS